MKNCMLFLLFHVAGTIAMSAQTLFPPQGPFLGQQLPEMQSILFAPGFISTGAGELNSVFCCDGQEFYFSRRELPGKPSMLMASKQTENTWSEPAPLEFSGVFNDIDLFVTADGRTMVFCSKRPHADGEGEKADHDFWISERIEGVWSEPEQFAPEVMSDSEDFYPVLTSSGNLYFNSQRGAQRGNNIYLSRFLKGQYVAAEKLPEPINSEHWEFDAFVTPDENMMLFSSTRPGGYGGADIYISFREGDNAWSEPRNLGPQVNSADSEYGASLSPDGKYFFYTSNREGSEDIFWISSEILNREPMPDETNEGTISYPEVFMTHFRQHWDDIHDVIIRFHYEDPLLKGKVCIQMTWQDGKLTGAEVIENTTGNMACGEALIRAMEAWEIPAIDRTWSSALPIRTTIKGSDDPAFGPERLFAPHPIIFVALQKTEKLSLHNQR